MKAPEIDLSSPFKLAKKHNENSFFIFMWSIHHATDEIILLLLFFLSFFCKHRHMTKLEKKKKLVRKDVNTATYALLHIRKRNGGSHNSAVLSLLDPVRIDMSQSSWRLKQTRDFLQTVFVTSKSPRAIIFSTFFFLLL